MAKLTGILKNMFCSGSLKKFFGLGEWQLGEGFAFPDQASILGLCRIVLTQWLQSKLMAFGLYVIICKSQGGFFSPAAKF